MAKKFIDGTEIVPAGFANGISLQLASKEANKAYSEHFLKPVHFDERVNNTRWCIMRYPSPAFAMNAKLPTREFTQFYYDACLVDYGQLKKAMEPLEKRLREADQVHLRKY